MSRSSTSGGGGTSPYPSLSFQVINSSDDRRGSASPTSGTENGGASAESAEAGTSNYYASGNSRITLSNAVSSSLVPARMHHTDYMYAMDARDNMHEMSDSNSLLSVAFEDSQKRSYHPIEFAAMAEGAGAGTSIESLESGRLQRHTGESSPASGVGLMVSVGYDSPGPDSSVVPLELTPSSPPLPRPVTYGLGPPTGPHDNNDTKLYVPSPSSASGLGDSFSPVPPPTLPAAADHTTAPSDPHSAIRSGVVANATKQQLPHLRSSNLMASTTATTVDRSPLEPSMTARGATPNRSPAPSLNTFRFPILPSPNSSVDTHASATATPFSESQRGADGRNSAFPTQHLPSPPERPPVHLPRNTRRSSNDLAGLTPVAATQSNPPSTVKTTPYQTPLALLAASSSSSSTSTAPSNIVAAVPSALEHNADEEKPSTSSAAVHEAQQPATLTAPVVLPPPPPPSSQPQPSAPTALPAPDAAAQATHPKRNDYTSSDSSSSNSAPQHPPKPPSPRPPPPVSVPSPPPPPSPSASSSDEADFPVRFAPLIQQTDYYKSDVKNIACTGAFTMGDVPSTMVKLRLLRHELLGRAEPLPVIQQSALRAGRVKRPKTVSEQEKSGETPAKAVNNTSDRQRPPRAVHVEDFRDTFVVFDNVLLAVSFALWGSVAHYNALVRGLLRYCAADVEKSEGNGGGESDPDGAKADAVSPSSAVTKSRLKVPFSSVLRFLNHSGVDVLVVSSNRKAASSFCAKRQQVRRRVRRDGATAGAAALHDNSNAESGGGETHGDEASAPLRRVLIALSYDTKQQVWCPLTLSRPVRQIAAAWHEHRRHTRQQERQTERRTRRREEAEAAVKEKKAAMEAKLDAWRQRVNAFSEVEDASAGPTTTATQKHVTVVVPRTDATTDDSNSPLTKAGNKLPFDGIFYPNLIQTDVGFGVVVKQGLHPLFGVVRLRLMAGVPLGFITLFFGLAFIIYATKTTGACLFDSVTRQCAAPDADMVSSSSSSSSSEIGSSESRSCFAMLAGTASDSFNSKLSNRFLYGKPASPGNCLIVTLCCVFAAIVDSVLITFFAARYLALGGVRPCFHYLLQAIQFVLSAIACAFAAYVLFRFHGRRHTIRCDVLDAADASLCTARLRSCGSRYFYEAHTRLTGTNVALVLSIVYLVLCVVHWLFAFLPVVPSPSRQDAIPTATPDTYTFRPSLFAPDGPTPGEIEQLREVMQAPLRQDLQQCVQQRDRLLTAATTIGEMMQANRTQSLKQMKLNEQRRLHRARPFAEEHTKGRDGSRGSATDKAGPYRKSGRRRKRYLVWGGEETLDSGSNGDDSDSTRSDPSAAVAAARDRTVVLAPRLVQRVNEIGSRVRAQASQSRRTSNPLNAADVPAAFQAGDGETKPSTSLDRSSSPSSAPAADTSYFVTRTSLFGRKPGSLPKVAVVVDDDSTNAVDAPESGVAVAPPAVPSASSKAENKQPMYVATFSPLLSAQATPAETSLPLQRPPVPLFHPPARSTKPMQKSQPGSAPSSVPEARPALSLPSNDLSQLAGPSSDRRSSMVSPLVESEIAQIVSRLQRAQQS